MMVLFGGSRANFLKSSLSLKMKMIRFTAPMFIFVRETRDCSKTDTSTKKLIFPSCIRLNIYSVISVIINEH